MIKHLPEDVANGIRPYWRVEDPSVVLIDTYQELNRASVLVTTQNTTSIVDHQLFPVGDQVALILPVGRWQFYSSSDGKNYREVTALTSTELAIDGTSHPSQEVTLTIDGQTPFPQVWGRYKKLGVTTPLAPSAPPLTSTPPKRNPVITQNSKSSSSTGVSGHSSIKG